MKDVVEMMIGQMPIKRSFISYDVGTLFQQLRKFVGRKTIVYIDQNLYQNTSISCGVEVRKLMYWGEN